jgi:hypothetical protein
MARQFRSDDTDKWLYGFGDGSAGVYSSSGNATHAPIDASCSGTADATSLSATNTSFAAGQLILIHQTRGTGAGAWELNRIASYTAGTITLSHALQNTYTDSGASQAQVQVMPQYSSFTQGSGHTLTAKAWDGNVGGIIAFFCSGTTTITGSLTGLGKGYRGGAAVVAGSGAGNQGESYNNTGTTSTSANSGGGGGGSNGNGGGGGFIAGGAGITDSGANGTAGTTPSAGNLTSQFYLGSGGGGARHSLSASSGAIGGGIILIISKTISVGGSIITTGAGSSNNAYRAGGAGSGGSVLLKAQDATLGTGLASAGGVGGTSEGGVNRGGAGSVGRIHLDYSGSYSITSSTPSINVALDSTIIGLTSGALFFAQL